VGILGNKIGLFGVFSDLDREGFGAGQVTRQRRTGLEQDSPAMASDKSK
jgi:hypothetical protein